jgi:hypothetical protein
MLLLLAASTLLRVRCFSRAVSEQIDYARGTIEALHPSEHLKKLKAK